MQFTILTLFLLLASSALHAQNTKAKTSDDNRDQVFTKVETQSGYKLGRSAFMRYLQKSMRYPQDAREKNISGKVVVKFIVTKLGTVSEVEAISGPDLLRAEAVRLVKESGEWIPANQCGRYVKSYKTEEIEFKL